MRKNNIRTIATWAFLGMGMSAFSAQALDQGDMFMRVTATQVAPNDSSTGFSGAPTVFPETGDSTTLGFTFVYMMSSNLGFEVLAALPFEHDVNVEGMGTVGTTKQLPPTFSLQYYFNPEKAFRPYVGAGINYTIFFDDSSVDALGGDLALDNSIGLAAQVGFDYDINKSWFLNADIRYINLETTAEIAAVGTSDVDINPTVVSLGLGYKF